MCASRTTRVPSSGSSGRSVKVFTGAARLKGPDVFSRGVAPERDAFFFIDELEALLREWIAVYYHNQPHEGVGEVGLWKLGISRRMFEHGVSRAGYIEAPRDPDFAYNFLKVEWRTIQPYGIQIDNRIYRGPGLMGYRPGEKSPFREHQREWPFHVDSNYVRFIYFFDRMTRSGTLEVGPCRAV